MGGDTLQEKTHVGVLGPEVADALLSFRMLEYYLSFVELVGNRFREIPTTCLFSALTRIEVYGCRYFVTISRPEVRDETTIIAMLYRYLSFV